METATGGGGVTVWIGNVPATAIADELFSFFEASVGSVYACKIAAGRGNWRSRGHGLVQFQSPAAAAVACSLAAEGRLGPFQRAQLDVRPSSKDIVTRAVDVRNRVIGATLHAGVMKGESQMLALAEWGGVRVEVMPERKKIELFVRDGGERYKMEVMYGDVISSLGCRVGGGDEELNAILLQLNSAPRIYQMICRNSKAINFRYQRSICEEDFQSCWVRTTDFSLDNSIGKSSYLCVRLVEGSSSLEILRNLPSFRELGPLDLVNGELMCASKLAPVHDGSIAFEVLFQLNSLVHMQKVSSAQVDSDLFDLLSKLSPSIAVEILQRLHKLKSTCYKPMEYIQNQLAFF